jgi:hypothetical protein
MLYIMIRGLIKGTPRTLAMVCLVLFLFGTCSGVISLGQYAFFNPGSIVFFAVALFVCIPALLKYLLWRKSGLIQPLPKKAVVFQLDHVTSVETRYRPLLSVRETTTYGAKQAVILTPPETGSQDVSVVCKACQQEAVFRVDSLHVRMQRRLRTALIWGTGLVVALALGIVSSDAVQTEPAAGWVSLVRIVYIVLFLCSTIGIGTLLAYTGARYRKLPRGHRVRYPEKDELASLRSTLGTA